MTPRVRQILKWAGYVGFYLFSLLVFAYLTFPYNRLGDRIVQEFNAKQAGPKPMRLKTRSSASLRVPPGAWRAPGEVSAMLISPSPTLRL